MSPIPLNISRFYRFHYTITPLQQKFSLRLIFAVKAMKFTDSTHWWMA